MSFTSATVTAEGAVISTPMGHHHEHDRVGKLLQKAAPYAELLGNMRHDGPSLGISLDFFEHIFDRGNKSVRHSFAALAVPRHRGQEFFARCGFELESLHRRVIFSIA